MIDLYPELTKLQKMWKSGEYTELDECNLLKQHCERCICKANMKMNFAIVEECNYLMRDEPAAKWVEDWFDRRDSRFIDYVNDHVNPVALLKHIMKSEFDKYIFKTKKKDNLPESDINLDNISNLKDFTEEEDMSADERSINDKKQDMRDKYQREENFAFLDLNDLMKFASV